jgi:hypothetical protein
MRTIIAGSRGLGLAHVRVAMGLCGWIPSVVISGAARGVDEAGERWAKEKGIPVEVFPADWEGYGNSAGYIRNKEMAANAEALVAVWDGYSKGTKHMISTAEYHGLSVFVHIAAPFSLPALRQIRLK